MSGILVVLCGEQKTFRGFVFVAAFAMFVFYYMRETLLSGRGLSGMLVYYFAAAGFGGAFNIIFMIAESETPPEYLGATMNLSIAAGQLSVSLSSQFVVFAMPTPIYIYQSLTLLALAVAEWIFRNSYRNFKNASGAGDFKTEMQSLTENL